ncbi:MAG TPA: hypothetical protein VGO80_06160 [Solirubrobacteraceae bacterium]|jgi:hypothetical protein|nr:hypothetical protein [Solirubrobacteraceae bacterium]
MTSAREHPTIVQARRRIRNLAACVRRDVTGWVRGRTVAGHYQDAFAALVAVEDALGVDRAGPLSDRLRDVRWEAQAAGLLEPAEILDAETHALAAAGCVA